MSVNTVNRIIEPPVSIDDLKQVLGSSSNDLYTLCKNDNINPWARCKPVAYAKNFTDNPPVREDKTITTTSDCSHNCFVRCGMLVPGDTFKNINLTSITNDFTKDNVWGQTGTKSKGYYKIKGGASEPCRIGDFRGYYLSAGKTFTLNTPTFTTIPKTYHTTRTFEVILSEIASKYTRATTVYLEDMFADFYTNWSLWLYVKENSSYSYIKVADISNNENFVYARGNVTFTSNYPTMIPCLIHTRKNFQSEINANDEVVALWASGSIYWTYSPRTASVFKLKSGSSDWAYPNSLAYIYGGNLRAIVEIDKTQSSRTFSNRQFRCNARYNGKTTTSYANITNSSGQYINTFTVPSGSGKVQCYLEFQNVHDTSVSTGTTVNLSFEWYDDNSIWSTLYGGCYLQVRY